MTDGNITTGGSMNVTATPPPNGNPPPEQNGTPSGDRPGGPPARTLDAERMARLEQQITDLTANMQQTVQQAMGAKETKRDAETRLQEIEAQLAASNQELALARLADQAVSVGARNGKTVARIVAGEPNPLAAIEALKQSDPYLFGPPPRPAGADMTDTTAGQAKGLPELDKFLADRFT